MTKKQTISEKQLDNLGNRLRAVRKAKGYTNYEHFAYRNGFNRVQYGRYENGANISFKTLVKLIDAFDLTITDFFSEGFETDLESKD